jgi:hypothetical protein
MDSAIATAILFTCTFAFQTPGAQVLDFDLPDKRHGARSIEIVNWTNVADLAV